MSDGMLYCSVNVPDMFWIAIALMGTVVALFYMLGRILAKSDFEAMARVEMREVIISIAIAFGAVGLAFSLCNISTAALPFFSEAKKVGDFDQFRLAEIYLGDLSNSVGVPTIMNLESVAYSTYLLQATVRSSTGVNFMSVFRTLGESIGILASLIFAPLLASLNIQLISMSLSKYLALSIILPAGIITRAFKPTREGGAFLIALAIGMHFLWPFLYLINYELTLRLFTTLQTPVAPPTALASFTGAKPIFDIVNMMIDFMFNNLSYGSQLLLQGLVLPILNITLFIGFVKVFSDFINNIR
jgi:hypothetical protein